MGFRKQIITDTIVKGLKPGDTVMDTKVEGFGVRRQTRRAHYFVRKHHNGRRCYQSIGAHGPGEMTAGTARKRAAAIISAILENAPSVQSLSRDLSDANKRIAELQSMVSGGGRKNDQR